MKPKVIIKWLVIIGAVSVVSVLIGLILSTLIHFQLKYKAIEVEQLSLSNMLNGVKMERQHFLLFISISFAAFLLVILLFISNKHNHYESELKTITPKIKTPVSAGQAQHGSAKWLHKSQYSKVFAVETIVFKDKLVKELIRRGYETIRKDKENKPSKPIVKKEKKQKEKIRPSRQISIVSKGWSGDWINE